jgi:hypothetical protein
MLVVATAEVPDAVVSVGCGVVDPTEEVVVAVGEEQEEAETAAITRATQNRRRPARRIATYRS